MTPETNTPAGRPRRAVTVRLARWSATHKWRAIALWLVFVACCMTAGQLAGLRQASNLDTSTAGQSRQAMSWLQGAHLTPPDTEDVLITSTHGALDPTAAARAASGIRTRMLQLPQVARVATPVTSPDRSAVVVEVTLHADSADDAAADVQPLLDATAAVQRANPSLRIAEAGDESVNSAVNDQVSRDLSSAAVVSLPVTLIILLIAFGAILAAGVPVLLALSAVGAAIGLSTLASHVIPDSGSTSSVILLMGMAVGVDYSLFYVKRARAERRAGHHTLDAVEIAAETSGHSVLVSGVAVIVAMLGMYVSGSLVFASLATGSIIVVAVAVLGSLTVLPAMLVAFGSKIDRPRVPGLWRLTAQDREPRLWSRVLRPSLAHPGRTLTISVGALALVALPALGMHLTSDSAKSLPTTITEKQTLDRLTSAFPTTNTTVDVVVRSGAGARREVHRALLALDRRARLDSHFVSGGRPELTLARDGRTQYLQLDMPFDAESPAARAGVEQLRTTLVPAALQGVAGAQFAVGGETASDLDVDNQFSARLPWVIATVVLLTLLLTGFVFRSAVLAFCTAGMNLLSAGTAFGVLSLVFQHHWADGVLGYTSTGRLINWIPLFTFTVLFGLSMDYHVFVINSIREATARGLSVRDAVRVGVGRSAGTVTAAAVVMVSVFGIFASLHMVEMKELGVGLAVAVLVDAVVVRTVVLPSLLVLLGDRVRWPGRGLSATAEHEPRTLVGAS